ncbi:MAG: hypothetical protein RSC10_08855 [Longicatena sp.]
MYKINDRVYHPSLGICSITAVDNKTNSITISSVSKEDYSCTFPFASFEKIGIRAVISESDAHDMLKRMQEPIFNLSENPKTKGKELEKLAHNPDIASHIEAFSYLMYQKYTMKKSGSINDQLLTALENSLCDEICIVLDKDKKTLLSKLRVVYESRAEKA